MMQLSGLDATFLSMETATTTGHVGSVQVLDPATASEPLTLDSFTRAIAPRIDLVPMCRRKLVTVPLGLDNPYWIDDPDFDIEFHVRELALPAPGSEKQLTEQVARLHARPLDRNHPLWEMYLITGLAEGRAAIYTKIHHAAIDGVSGNEILEVLLDTTPAGRVVGPPPDRATGSQLGPARLLLRGAVALSRQPARVLRLSGALARSAPSFAAAHLPDVPVVSRLLAPLAPEDRPGALRAPETPFNGPISRHRKVAFGSVPLAGVKSIRAAGGATLNDVVLAMCAGGLRTWLADQRALPMVPLIGGVPVSVRSDDERGAGGNRVSMMFTPLPTHLSDPVERLTSTRDATAAAKERFEAVPATLLMEMTALTFPSLANQAFRLGAQLRVLERVRPFNVIISNVPGPRVPLYIAGAELVAYYPVSAIADGQGLNITVFSYRDTLAFGLVACRELVPDLDALVACIVAEFHTLLDAVGPS
ncbi:WS/DGAT/MGAT family O-acyltransferase [Marmoricola sp. RAF53]|uniref:WS/DGAT/MGAT family O-acyltransferase n=1 Tax=Marmoricola sp. RAF53 TaxID=3233059 RepID=UPI003F9B01DF